MDKYNVNVSAFVTVEIDPAELGEDDDENSLIFRALEEEYPDLRYPSINHFEKR